MDKHEISRRAMLQGSAALAGLMALGFPLEALEVAAADGEMVVPWLDQPPPFPGPPEVVATQLVWEEVDAQLTWNEKFFTVQHYGQWLTIREPGWRLAVGGLVGQPMALTLAELRWGRSTQDRQVHTFPAPISAGDVVARCRHTVLAGTVESTRPGADILPVMRRADR